MVSETVGMILERSGLTSQGFIDEDCIKIMAYVKREMKIQVIGLLSCYCFPTSMVKPHQ